MRKTKIICTLGPSTDDPAVLRELMLSGMDVARINMSHQDHAHQLVRINQIKKLREMKEKRDNVRVKTTLDAIREGAKGEVNLMPLILDAVHAYATEGEICGVLREVFGEYKENVVL